MHIDALEIFNSNCTKVKSTLFTCLVCFELIVDNLTIHFENVQNISLLIFLGLGMGQGFFMEKTC